jgi:hypothetical protein
MGRPHHFGSSTFSVGGIRGASLLLINHVVEKLSFATKSVAKKAWVLPSEAIHLNAISARNI